MFPECHLPTATLRLTAQLMLEVWYPGTPESMPRDTGKTWQTKSGSAVLQATISSGFPVAEEATKIARGA